jgi:molybdate transport system ATP-binding protein
MVFEIDLSHTIGERQIELRFATDERLVALVGPSGAGKTTLLNCIAGLIPPQAGRVAIAGQVLLDTGSGVDLPPERRRAGYVFQDFRLFPHMRVAGNLAYGERLAAPEHRWADRAEIVELLGIGHLLERWPSSLSGGELRRVAIGRALLSGARFLLLDEPFASLDSARAERLRALVETVRDELAVPILLVSHDQAEVERLAGLIVTLG